MSQKKILVIDDDEAIQEVVQGCLEELAQWEVITASSGEEGLQIASSIPVDGILLDVFMTGMDGLETWKKLQENPVTKDIPVILLTARVQPSETAYFSQLGVTRVLVKPFNPLTLAARVAQLFEWDEV
ncbi:response regulator receiver protein [Gloeothece citriformis PCC 7424]|uniref:Response regulator receiver protein n=1 Tax=Gloeothece citriformis (strain PCC 7424) TaxID=65393 RepID=B7KAD9_GLOC7|nr:response regulator [Gloeothece citriformis]ACK72913.1 response regulator receiver protein [Gloeothece citriformis PCC 7424]